MPKIESSKYQIDSRRVASRMLLEASRHFPSPEEPSPVSQIRRRTKCDDVPTTVREMRIDANLKKTLFVPESEYLERIRQQVIAEIIGL